MTWIINVSNRLTFETLGIIYKKKKVTLRKKKFSNYSRSPRRSSWSLPQPRPRFFQLYSRRCTKILRGSWRLPGLSLKLRQEKNNERRWYVIRRWNLMGGRSTKNVRRKRKKKKKEEEKNATAPLHSFNANGRKPRYGARISLAGIPPFITGARRKLNIPDEWGMFAR